ncbi:MAG: TSUP family transporter [Solirubrobacteraceae bacterium]
MIWLILIGIAAGVLGGLLGVGGGVLFVPGLVIVVGLTQHEAEATSLLAIVPVALVGAVRQNRYGNVRRDDALLMGVLSVAGVAAGVALANALSGTVLRTAFALLILLIAAQLVRKALREGRESMTQTNPDQGDPPDGAGRSSRYADHP